jgi:plasmid stabilization system protein ParE
MDFRVIFAPNSIRDLADSVAYIARFDPEAAARIGDGLIDRAEAFLSNRHPAFMLTLGQGCLSSDVQ